MVLDKDETNPWVVQSISPGEVWLRPHNDARETKYVRSKESADRKAFRFTSMDRLHQRHARKVTITPLGEVVYVRD